jgi:hypothetical protein
MNKLFAVKLKPDHEVEILFAAPTEDGPSPYGAAEEIIRKGVETLDGAMDAVRAVAQRAVEKLDGLNVESSEVTIGLKLSATGKFVVAEAAGAASLNVKFKLKGKP